MPGELDAVQRRQMLQDREIRRIKLWLSKIAVSDGVRATAIIGIVPVENLPVAVLGHAISYIGFGDEPVAGIAHSGANATAYTMDLLVQT